MNQETMPMPIVKPKKHYINNADFCRALLDYQEAVAKAKKTETTKPKIPNYIGECFMKIAEGLSHKPNFINYSYRDEMVGDGIENCLMYFQNLQTHLHTTHKLFTLLSCEEYKKKKNNFMLNIKQLNNLVFLMNLN